MSTQPQSRVQRPSLWFQVQFVCRSVWHRLTEPAIIAGAFGVGLAAACGAQDPKNIRSFWRTASLRGALILFGAAVAAFVAWQATTETIMSGMALRGMWTPDAVSKRRRPLPVGLLSRTGTGTQAVTTGPEPTQTQTQAQTDMGAEWMARTAATDSLLMAQQQQPRL